MAASCGKAPQRKPKPIDSTAVFTIDTLITNLGYPGGSTSIKKVNLRGDIIDSWQKNWNADGATSKLIHFNLSGNPVYSIDSIFDRNNKLVEMKRSIDSLSEYKHYFFNAEGDTIKRLIAIHTQKNFIVFQATHSSQPDFSALLDGGNAARIKIKETDFQNAERSFNTKCDLIGMPITR